MMYRLEARLLSTSRTNRSAILQSRSGLSQIHFMCLIVLKEPFQYHFLWLQILHERERDLLQKGEDHTPVVNRNLRHVDGGSLLGTIDDAGDDRHPAPTAEWSQYAALLLNRLIQIVCPPRRLFIHEPSTTKTGTVAGPTLDMPHLYNGFSAFHPHIRRVAPVAISQASTRARSLVAACFLFNNIVQP